MAMGERVCMDAERMLRRYPRETLRWLRGRLGQTQLALALEIEAPETSVGRWESRQNGVGPTYRAQLAALLAPHLATPEGEAFIQSLGRGEDASVEEGGGG